MTVHLRVRGSMNLAAMTSHYFWTMGGDGDDPEGAKGHGPHTHDRLKVSCESCCRRDSVFRGWQRLNLSRIHYQAR